MTAPFDLSTSIRTEAPAPVVMADDIMLGAASIAAFMGMRPRQLYHAAEMGHLPTFRIGGMLCARKSTLTHWIADLEQDAVSGQTLRRVSRPDPV